MKLHSETFPPIFDVRPLVLIGLLVLFPRSGNTQTDLDGFVQLEFNFNTPGARAVGMGGAFISIADDATAAEANPAGLTALLTRELSFEAKLVRYRREIALFSHRGTFTSFEVVSKDFYNNVVSPSFISLVWPVWNRVTISAFRHELVNFESAFYSPGGYLPTFHNGQLFLPLQSDLDILVANWGGAIGIKLHNAVSVGGTVGFSHADINFRQTVYGLPVFDYRTRQSTSVISDTAEDLFYSLGVQFKPTDRLAFGAVFKHRPKLHVVITVRQFTSFFVDADDDFSEASTHNIPFSVPSTYGAGVSVRPLEQLTLSFDAVRVLYSQLTDDFVSTLGVPAITGDDYSSDDGMEFHFGLEYVGFFKDLGYAVRAGAFTEPDSQIRFDGEPRGNFNRQASRIAFPGGESDFHYTFGVGLILKSSQIDIAGNLSRGSDELILSFVYQFGK